jgi:hypothetical protein
MIYTFDFSAMIYVYNFRYGLPYRRSGFDGLSQVNQSAALLLHAASPLSVTVGSFTAREVTVAHHAAGSCCFGDSD